MHIRHSGIRQHVRRPRLHLVLERARHHVILAGHQSLNPFLRHFRRIVLSLAPSFVCSMPARWKKFVSVAPGISAVMVTPLSFNSFRIACANEDRNAFRCSIHRFEWRKHGARNR